MATPTIEILNKGRGVIAEIIKLYANTSKLRLRLTAPGESDTVIGIGSNSVKLGRLATVGDDYFFEFDDGVNVVFAPASENPDKEFNLIHVYTIIPSGITYKEVYLEVKETIGAITYWHTFSHYDADAIIDLTSESGAFSMLLKF